jgi:hypothetical protein
MAMSNQIGNDCSFAKHLALEVKIMVFGYDLKNGGFVPQHVLSHKRTPQLKAISTKSKSKFEALHLEMVTFL